MNAFGSILSFHLEINLHLKSSSYYTSLVIRVRCDAEDALSILGNKYGCDAENEAPALMLLAKKLNMKVANKRICNKNNYKLFQYMIIFDYFTRSLASVFM